jgi:hypothetical protein
MAKAVGRRPNEPPSETTSPPQRPETWTLVLVAALIVLALAGLLAFALFDVFAG